MKKKRFPPVWQPGEGLALMIFRRVLTNQAWLRLSVPAAHSAAACIYSEFSKFGLHAYF